MSWINAFLKTVTGTRLFEDTPGKVEATGVSDVNVIYNSHAFPTAKTKYPSAGQEGAIITTLPANVFARTSEGREYGASARGIYYSDDEWHTNTPLWDPVGVTINYLYDFYKLLPNGRIMVSCSDSVDEHCLYLSDDAADESKVFTKVLTFQYGMPNNLWGYSIHGDLIFLSEYGSFTAGENARFAYMSADGGQTWRQIFEGSSEQDFHIHDIGYDSYHSVVYIVTGDLRHRNIYWSFDFGANWDSLWEPGTVDYNVKTQYVSVEATPHYILLGTDDPINGIHVVKKNFVNGRMVPITEDDIYIRYAYDDADTLTALFHGITYINGAWYAVSSNTTVDFYPVIVASPNGWDWYEIYRHPILLTGDYFGFFGVFRCGDYFYANFSDDTSYRRKFKISLPTWIEM